MKELIPFFTDSQLWISNQNLEARIGDQVFQEKKNKNHTGPPQN